MGEAEAGEEGGHGGCSGREWGLTMEMMGVETGAERAAVGRVVGNTE